MNKIKISLTILAICITTPLVYANEDCKTEINNFFDEKEVLFPQTLNDLLDNASPTYSGMNGAINYYEQSLMQIDDVCDPNNTPIDSCKIGSVQNQGKTTSTVLTYIGLCQKRSLDIKTIMKLKLRSNMTADIQEKKAKRIKFVFNKTLEKYGELVNIYSKIAKDWSQFLGKISCYPQDCL